MKNLKAETICKKESKNSSGLRIIGGTIPYLWPAGNKRTKLRVVFALLALLVSKILSALAPLLLASAVDFLAEAKVSLFYLGAIGLTVSYGLARLLANGFQQLRDVIFAKVSQGALRQLAVKTFTHIHRLSLRYHTSRKTGALARIMERGIKSVDFLLRYLLFSIVPLVLEFTIIIIVLLVKLEVKFVVIILVTVGIYIIYTFAVTEWRLKIRRKLNEQDMDANQKAIDSLLNFETVKYFGAEEREKKRYDTSMKGYEEAAIKTSYSLAILNFGQTVLVVSGLVAVMVLAAVSVQEGVLSVGDFVLVNSYMIQLTLPLNFLGTVYREIRQALLDMAEMFSLLDKKLEINDVYRAKDLIVHRGEIKFEKVKFDYEDNRSILKELELTIPAGHKIAVVGPSGSGKSTIGRLLFRFFDVSSGNIYIDGQDIREVTQKSLHEAIGVVPQDTVLFNDTLFYNIAYGKENSTLEEVEKVAKDAHLHDFVESLPFRYNTLVGERGLKLSGGEKQRVGIARAMLKNPPILFLDEATSSLDGEIEDRIQQSITPSMGGRTVLIVAHRLSTIINADTIYFLDHGRVIEHGNHKKLLAKKGRYYNLWQIQKSKSMA